MMGCAASARSANSRIFRDPYYLPRTTGGGIHRPRITFSFGQYSRSERLTFPSGAGSQLLS
jgi:hypothetical protein